MDTKKLTQSITLQECVNICIHTYMVSMSLSMCLKRTSSSQSLLSSSLLHRSRLLQDSRFFFSPLIFSWESSDTHTHTHTHTHTISSACFCSRLTSDAVVYLFKCVECTVQLVLVLCKRYIHYVYTVCIVQWIKKNLTPTERERGGQQRRRGRVREGGGKKETEGGQRGSRR